MSHADPGPLSTYNSLQDKNLVGFFNNSRMRRHLRKSGLINRRGEIVTESSYRLTMARKEHQKHVRDLMAQAIVHKALDMERHRQASIKRKLEEIAKVKLVQRVRSERARKGDEDITPFLSPRAPQGRPHSAHSNHRRHRLGANQRPLTAPTNKSSSSSSSDKQAVYVDEDGFPIHREKRRSDTTEEIDSHNLRELDPKIMNSVSLHMRPEDREGLAPYRVNQSFEPHPPTAHVRPKRSRPKPQKSKIVINKDGKKLKPKSHKGSLALHRKEPAFPHANQLQTLCDVTVRYRGNSLKIQYEREDLRDEIMVYQQHCGGENLLVFEGMAEPGTDLVFTSRRHRGYPFSVTFFVNRVQSLRLSACCEYKYTPHSLLGGAKGHFKFIRVDGAAPCYRCMVEAELARRERQRYRGTQTDQPDPPPEPEPEMTVIATQTEENGEEEESKGEDHSLKEVFSSSELTQESPPPMIGDFSKLSPISSESLRSLSLDTDNSVESPKVDGHSRRSTSAMSGEGERSTFSSDDIEKFSSKSSGGQDYRSQEKGEGSVAKNQSGLDGSESQRERDVDPGDDVQILESVSSVHSDMKVTSMGSKSAQSSCEESASLVEGVEALNINEGKGDGRKITSSSSYSSRSKSNTNQESSRESATASDGVGNSSTFGSEVRRGRLQHFDSDAAYGFKFGEDRPGSGTGDDGFSSRLDSEGYSDGEMGRVDNTNSTGSRTPKADSSNSRMSERGPGKGTESSLSNNKRIDSGREKAKLRAYQHRSIKSLKSEAAGTGSKRGQQMARVGTSKWSQRKAFSYSEAVPARDFLSRQKCISVDNHGYEDDFED